MWQIICHISFFEVLPQLAWPIMSRASLGETKASLRFGLPRIQPVHTKPRPRWASGSWSPHPIVDLSITAVSLHQWSPILEHTSTRGGQEKFVSLHISHTYIHTLTCMPCGCTNKCLKKLFVQVYIDNIIFFKLRIL